MEVGTTKKQSQISKAIARLDKIITQINFAIKKHEESLDEVLRGIETEQGLPEEAKKQENQVGIAIVLNDFGDRLQDIVSKLDSIQNRLEL